MKKENRNVEKNVDMFMYPRMILRYVNLISTAEKYIKSLRKT